MGVLPLLGKSSLPLGGGARHWGSLSCSRRRLRRRCPLPALHRRCLHRLWPLPYPSAESLSLLLLQVSALSDGSLPLGQGGQRPRVLPQSKISTISYQSTQSRDPHLNRSASAHSRHADTEAEDDFALPTNTNARPGRKCFLSGGKSGPRKATKKQSKGRSVLSPSQHISQDASPLG
jgi:hypothetical protein